MADHVVPQLNGHGPMPSGVEELSFHLAELQLNPQTEPDEKMFDAFQMQLTDASCIALVPALVPALTMLTAALPDPARITSLLTRILRPLSFQGLISTVPDSRASVVASLSPRVPDSVNLLGLALVRKAAADGLAAEALSSPANRAMLDALLRRWMAAPSVGVGETAGHIVLGLLDVDCPHHQRIEWGFKQDGAPRDELRPVIVTDKPPGCGALWRLFFGGDRSVVDRIILPCTGRQDPYPNPDSTPGIPSSSPVPPTPRQTSLAQDRLLRVLPYLAALDLPAVLGLRFPLSDSNTGSTSLLDMAATVVDTGDLLMAECLMDFFETLVCFLRLSRWADAPEMEEVRRVVVRAMTRTPVLRGRLLALSQRYTPEARDEMRIWVDKFTDEQELRRD